MIDSSFDPIQLLYENNLSEEQFAETKLEWDCLQDICDHHIQTSSALQTAARYILERLESVSAVHSLKVRVKDPKHLIVKIIRKKLLKPELDFRAATYEALITDLIGIRALHLFKHEWRNIHDFITNTWELHESPLAYVRKGDPQELQDDFRNAGCEVKDHPFGYRSLHYIVKSQPDKQTRLAEIQVRTIFEEGWSEIDHRVRYPLQSSDRFLAQFLTIFNRLAGSADEMGTFVQGLSVYFQEQATKVADIQTELKTKEQNIQGAVSALNISEKEKNALQKQIQDMQASSRAAIQPINKDLIGWSSVNDRIPEALKAVSLLNTSMLFPAKCAQCGETYSAIGPMGLYSLCPKCISTISGAMIKPFGPP